MFDSNVKFQEFRAKLSAQGVELRAMWSTKRNPHNRKGYDDVFMFVAYGKRCAVHTMIVVDYGPRDGFGIWFESPTNSIDADVATILGNPLEVTLPIGEVPEGDGWSIDTGNNQYNRWTLNPKG